MSERASQIHKDFEKHLADANISLVDLQEFLLYLQDNDLMGHLAAYRAIYEVDSLLDKLSKLVKAVKTDLSYKVIPEIMDNLKVDSMRYDGRNFIRSAVLRASIPEAKQSQGYQWLKDNGLKGLIKEGVNANSLSSVISDFIEETGIEPPEECMTLHRQNYIQVRK